MNKKILLTFLIVLTSFFAQGQITLTTTSSSGSWSPALVTNSGNQLTWTAASNGDFLGQIENADDPTFDFSANVNNNPISITITNAGNDFSELTAFDFWNDNGVGSSIIDIDVSKATSLTDLSTRFNFLTQLDVTQNTQLTVLNVRSYGQLSSGLDVSPKAV